MNCGLNSQETPPRGSVYDGPIEKRLPGLERCAGPSLRFVLVTHDHWNPPARAWYWSHRLHAHNNRVRGDRRSQHEYP